MAEDQQNAVPESGQKGGVRVYDRPAPQTNRSPILIVVILLVLLALAAFYFWQRGQAKSVTAQPGAAQTTP